MEKIRRLSAQKSLRKFTEGRERAIAGAFVLLFAILGVYYFGVSRAATLATSFEAESGTIGGNASTISDSGASGGSAVKFGSSSSGGPAFITGVSANGRYLVDQNSHPFLVNGDTAWNLAWGLSSTDQTTYLADRQSHGFNTTLTDLVGNSQMFGHANGANYVGDLPFMGSNFTPNPTYWAKIDTFFNLATAHGMSVLALPADNYAFGSGQVFSSMTDAQATAFGTFIAQRYPVSKYPGIVWMFGNDYGYNGLDTQYTAMINALRSAGDTRPMICEFGPWESILSDGNGADPQFSTLFNINAVYSYHPTYEAELRAYAKSPNAPGIFIEGAYENSTVGEPSTSLDIRKEAAWTLTSGASGEFYGNDSLWMWPSGWQTTQLDTSDVAQHQALAAAFAGIAWWNLVPDTSSKLVTAGRNTQWTSGPNTGSTTPNTSDSTYGWYVTAAYSADGKLGVIYNPDSTRNSITLSNSVLGTNPSITRVDPTNGATTNLGWTTNPAGGTNAGGDHDWLYIINAN